MKKTLKNKCACRWPWMEIKTHRRDLSHMWQCEHMSAMHLKTVRSVRKNTQCSRQCALWCSCNLSQCAQDCRSCAWRYTQCSVAYVYHKLFVNIRCKIYSIYNLRIMLALWLSWPLIFVHIVFSMIVADNCRRNWLRLILLITLQSILLRELQVEPKYCFLKIFPNTLVWRDSSFWQVA